MWVWAAITVAAALVRFDFRVGDASLATAVALLAGAVLPRSRAALTQAVALPFVLSLLAAGMTGGPAEWGYALGRVPLAWTAALLRERGNRRLEGALLLTIAVPAVVTGARWRSAGFGLDLRSYYLAVIALGVAIGFYYSLRLVEKPRRVLTLVAAFAPYYGAGIVGAAAAGRLLPTAAGQLPTSPIDLLFHGLLAHLPGDVLMAVAVAFFTGPKAGRAGPETR